LTIFIIASFLFYSLNITGFKIGKFHLATSCLKDEPIDLVFYIPYAIGVVLFLIKPDIAAWILLFLFVFIQIIFYTSTYKYWLKPNLDKIRSYNAYFAETHHIIKAQENRLVPDTFHLSIFLMFWVNLFLIIFYLIS